MKLDGTVQLWELLTAAGGALVFIIGLHYKNMMLTKDIDALRSSQSDLKRQVEHGEGNHRNLEMSVSTRLTILETTLSNGLAEIKALVGSALDRR